MTTPKHEPRQKIIATSQVNPTRLKSTGEVSFSIYRLMTSSCSLSEVLQTRDLDGYADDDGPYAVSISQC